MTDRLTIRLALQDELEFRSVDARLEPDGKIDISAQDMGPTVRAYHRESDYEFGIRIAPADAAKFAFALIAEHYRGDLQAVDKLRRIAEQSGIDPGFWVWA